MEKNSADITSMFESIKESLEFDRPSGDTSFRNILKMEVGNNYLVRFIPNIKEPKKTFVNYRHHGFKSYATGQYVDVICPRMFGERCPICEARHKLYNTGKESDKTIAYNIRPQDKHLANVYVVDDPTNADNVGEIKILRFGKRIYDKVMAAIKGDDADEFGVRVYDLTENGCNFKIKVESTSSDDKKRMFTNYNNSRFTTPSAIDGMTAERIKEVYDGIFELDDMISVKSYDDLVEFINEHIFVDRKNPGVAVSNVEDTKEDTSDETIESSDLPGAEAKESAPANEDSTVEENEKIKGLLDELDKL